LTRREAFDLYYARYVKKPNFDLIADVDYDTAYEVIDTGVNMGLEVAAKFLQQSLNALNNQEKLYPDVLEDGKVGRRTVSCLKSYLNHRGAEGVVVLLRCLNCLQGARYIELSSASPKTERFVYGWVLNRVLI
jgi:lysozyme family protein